MKKEDGKRFAALMAGMSESFGVAISEAGITMRFAALVEYQIEQVEAACIACMKSHKFSTMPTVAEIIENIGGGRVEDRGEIEAARVWKALSDHGAYSDMVFDDKTTMAVIALGFGGWTKLCQEMMADQQKWFLKEFVRMYGAYVRQGVGVGGKLTGLAAGREPVLIGDKAKCLAIMQDAPREALPDAVSIKQLVQL